jgi:hypothetical protein
MPAETAECKRPRMITGMETDLRRSRRRAGRSDDGTVGAKTAMLRGSVDGANTGKEAWKRVRWTCKEQTLKG